MSYLGRLCTRTTSSHATGEVSVMRPVIRSQSPIAAVDQRIGLADGAFDYVSLVAGEDSFQAVQAGIQSAPTQPTARDIAPTVSVAEHKTASAEAVDMRLAGKTPIELSNEPAPLLPMESPASPHHATGQLNPKRKATPSEPPVESTESEAVPPTIASEKPAKPIRIETADDPAQAPVHLEPKLPSLGASAAYSPLHFESESPPPHVVIDQLTVEVIPPADRFESQSSEQNHNQSMPDSRSTQPQPRGPMSQIGLLGNSFPPKSVSG
jgi:hypothetical protein